VKRRFEDQNYGDSRQQPPTRVVVDGGNPEFADLQDLLQRRMEAEQAYEDARYQRVCAQIKRRVTVAGLLDDLSKLDKALREAGGEGLDVDDLRKRHLPDGSLSPVKRPKTSSDITRVTTSRPNSDIKQSARARKR
jgi:IS5 family transposase